MSGHIYFSLYKCFLHINMLMNDNYQQLNNLLGKTYKLNLIKVLGLKNIAK